jgi:hypothetical protein
MISSAYLRKMKSPTPGFNKMGLLHTRLTTLWNFWMRFSENVISRNLWPPCLLVLTPPDFYLWVAAKSAVYCDCPRTLNELKTALTAYTRNISQADLQKVLANKIKWVQVCIGTCGHHFQHLL